MWKHDGRGSPDARSAAGAAGDGQALDGNRRYLQRIVKDPGAPSRGAPGATTPMGPPRPEEQRAAHLSPQLVNPAAAVPDAGVQFQCTECDMMVKEDDPYCPFCGAVFADGPPVPEDEAAEASERPESPEPMEWVEHVRPGKFDVFGMMRTRGRARELLYQEAVKGFAGSARLLEEIERLITDISSLGTDTTRARRLMSSAWEACRDGNWQLVSALAKQTEDSMAPSIPQLVRSELARSREFLMAARSAGKDVSEYLLRMKTAMHCLKSGDDDEALRLTKELMDLLREDSVSWRKGASLASGNPLDSRL